MNTWFYSGKSFHPKSPLTFSVSTRTDVFSQYTPKRGLLNCWFSIVSL